MKKKPTARPDRIVALETLALHIGPALSKLLEGFRHTVLGLTKDASLADAVVIESAILALSKSLAHSIESMGGDLLAPEASYRLEARLRNDLVKAVARIAPAYMKNGNFLIYEDRKDNA